MVMVMVMVMEHETLRPRDPAAALWPGTPSDAILPLPLLPRHHPDHDWPADDTRKP